MTFCILNYVLCLGAQGVLFYKFGIKPVLTATRKDTENVRKYEKYARPIYCVDICLYIYHRSVNPVKSKANAIMELTPQCKKNMNAIPEFRDRWHSRVHLPRHVSGSNVMDRAEQFGVSEIIVIVLPFLCVLRRSRIL
jgi:hypothetical protein